MPTAAAAMTNVAYEQCALIGRHSPPPLPLPFAVAPPMSVAVRPLTPDPRLPFLPSLPPPASAANVSFHFAALKSQAAAKEAGTARQAGMWVGVGERQLLSLSLSSVIALFEGVKPLSFNAKFQLNVKQSIRFSGDNRKRIMALKAHKKAAQSEGSKPPPLPSPLLGVTLAVVCTVYVCMCVVCGCVCRALLGISVHSIKGFFGGPLMLAVR